MELEFIIEKSKKVDFDYDRRMILVLTACGLNNREIAERLHVGYQHVKNRKYEMAKDLGIKAKHLTVFSQLYVSDNNPYFGFSTYDFTAGQEKVLERIATGESRKEVGAALNIDGNTVKNHMAQMRERSGLTPSSLRAYAAWEYLVRPSL